MKQKIMVVAIIMMVFGTKNNAKEVLLTDIQNHWASESIKRMVINGNINGYPDNTFRPDNEITVLEFLKILFHSFQIPVEEKGLHHWPDDYIFTANKYQLELDYDKPLTRYEMVNILSKMMDLSSVKQSKKTFPDITKEQRENIAKLVSLQIINGYEDGTFHGEGTLTRAEAATIITRAWKAQLELVAKEKVTLSSYNTNIGIEDTIFLVHQNRYVIDNHQVHFWDKGRFSYVENYTIQEKYVTNEKLIRMIETLVKPYSYTALYYAPSPYTINQIIIKYGASEKAVQQNTEYFSITYYEDKLYDLNRIAQEDIFSKECYMKIAIPRLWTELYEYQNGNYVTEENKKAIEKALKIEFGKDTEEILAYILERYEKNCKEPQTIAETKQINHFFINTYQSDMTSLAFYIEKLSS